MKCINMHQWRKRISYRCIRIMSSPQATIQSSHNQIDRQPDSTLPQPHHVISPQALYYPHNYEYTKLHPSCSHARSLAQLFFYGGRTHNKKCRSYQVKVPEQYIRTKDMWKTLKIQKSFVPAELSMSPQDLPLPPLNLPSSFIYFFVLSSQSSSSSLNCKRAFFLVQLRVGWRRGSLPPATSRWSPWGAY